MRVRDTLRLTGKVSRRFWCSYVTWPLMNVLTRTRLRKSQVTGCEALF